MTDFFLPNGNFREVGKSAKYELISYHTDRTIEGDGLEFISPTSSLPESDTQGQLTLDMIGSTFSNAPTPAVDYVSRTVLEKEILALLRDERHSIVTMVGRGGIGKTSLAVTVLRELAEAGDFFATFWFSARDIDLLAEGPKLVKPGVLSTEDIAREYLSLVNGDWKSSGAASVVEYFAQSLRGKVWDEPVLFVFDNFETVRSPTELYNFIDTHVRLPNKVLLTSRSRDFKGDYPVNIAGMRREEFDELVASTARRMGIGLLLNKDIRMNYLMNRMVTPMSQKYYWANSLVRRKLDLSRGSWQARMIFLRPSSSELSIRFLPLRNASS